MTQTPATPQLTLAELTAARNAVPTVAWGALTAAQQRFVAALVADPTRTYTAAAKIAGSPQPRKQGSHWASLPVVKAALDAKRATFAGVRETDVEAAP